MSEGYRPAARGLSRRSLFASTGLLGLAAVGMSAVSPPAGDVRHVLVHNATEEITATLPGPVVRIERVYSAARGREVDVVAIVPGGVPTDHLPMSILLHGRKGSARTAAVGGLAEKLAAAVTAGRVPPFGFLAVDGGDNYWHENHRGDDPMSMLLDEVPHWLASRGLAETPFACTGVSMGGFGAMLYARRRTERGNPARAVAAVSPGLLTSWADMSRRNAFASEAQWGELDPLRNIDKLGPAPMALWCGDRDRFVEGCRRFIAHAPLEIAAITPGGHNDDYWRTVTPDVVRFLGGHVG